jgi:hypothetical protein
MIATKKCPNCGLDNDIGRSVCANCTTALTEYGKQVGMANDFERRLTKQVDALDDRPKVVHAMAIFTALLALPLFGDVINSFRNVPKPDPENINAITSAFAALGPIFHAVVFIPLAIALIVLAFFTWTQRPWTWMVNLVALGVTAAVIVVQFHFHLSMFIGLALIGTLAYLWLQPHTKAWFGLS